MDAFQLDKNRGVVLYRQLANVLRQHFIESKLSIGARIPTEFELSRTFGVSRGTVRQALGLLQKEGLIDRVPGLGTFLSAQETSPAPSPSQRRIGLVIPYAQDQLSLNILIGAESVAKRRGYQLVFNHTNENLEQEREDVTRMRRDQVAGVILFPISNQEEDEMVWQLHEDRFPFVLVDRYFPGLNCCYVVSDNTGGAYRATEHLIILGYSQIAFLYHANADFRTTSVRDRYLGYRKALEEYNIEFDERWAVQINDQEFIARADGKQDPYYDFLTRPDRPRAVFAVNDNTAIDLLTSATRLGISVPGDLAIVGFDNLRMASQVPIPLTTINVHRTQIGEAAANLLIDRIEGTTLADQVHIVLPTELIVRESCGARQRLRQSKLVTDQAP